MTNKVAAVTTPLTHFAAVGGGSRSDFWCQILADASAREVKRLETQRPLLWAPPWPQPGGRLVRNRRGGFGRHVGKPSKTFRPRMKDSRR